VSNGATGDPPSAVSSFTRKSHPIFLSVWGRTAGRAFRLVPKRCPNGQIPVACTSGPVGREPRRKAHFAPRPNIGLQRPSDSPQVGGGWRGVRQGGGKWLCSWVMGCGLGKPSPRSRGVWARNGHTFPPFACHFDCPKGALDRRERSLDFFPTGRDRACLRGPGAREPRSPRRRSSRMGSSANVCGDRSSPFPRTGTARRPAVYLPKSRA
jgi:hypothetical protein